MATRTSSQRALDWRVAEIESLHRGLERIFRRFTSVQTLEIREERNWYRREIGRAVAFELTSTGEREVTLRRGRSEQHVFPIGLVLRSDADAWFGWYEEWKKKRVDIFALTGFSMTFYWGAARSREKAQVLRAEWDDPDSRGPNAAQPHWHIDRPIYAEVPVLASEGHTTDGLEELPVQGDALKVTNTAVDASGVHLGMAGWHHAAQRPACWQHPVNAPVVLQWVEHTLSLARHEFSALVSHAGTASTA